MTFLDICAGIGGFSLGLEWAGMTCKGQVEIDEYCNRVLAKHWPDVPRWGDLTTLDPACLPAVDLIAGGYPCQPFSHAGKRQGANDDRHLWPFIREIVASLRPAWCLFENVAGHVTLGLDAVLADLAGGGYSCWPVIIPACAVDAPHIRARVWILAYSECPERRPGESSRHDTNRYSSEWQKTSGGFGTPNAHGRDGLLAYPEGGAFGAGLCAGAQAGQRGRRSGDGCGQDGSGNCRWLPEPGMARVVNGLPHRLDRCRALGNAVVPQLVYEIGHCIMATNVHKDVP